MLLFDKFSDPCIDNGPCVTGTCYVGADSSSTTCFCDPEYEGQLCETSKFCRGDVCVSCVTGPISRPSHHDFSSSFLSFFFF